MDSGLYVVATPIGNLGDLTSRAVEVLQGVDLIAAENTRHSQRLLQHYAIETPLLAYHDHSEERTLNKVTTVIAQGGSVALISDAGTPLISDPGYRLVRRAQELGITVSPLPGACAAVAALSASGLATDRFLFEGFLPAKQGARLRRLEELAAVPSTLVFYEAPHRVLACLTDMAQAFGAQREAVLARELTKAFETLRREPLEQLVEFVAQDDNQRRGEIVLLVAGRAASERILDEEVERLLQRLVQDMPAKSAAAVVADVTGLRKKDLYRYLVDHRSPK
ncbi:MAG: 16S rRNA (cytidine1402-2'-O)-methyltransferase [Bacteroidia bacterium]